MAVLGFIGLGVGGNSTSPGSNPGVSPTAAPPPAQTYPSPRAVAPAIIEPTWTGRVRVTSRGVDFNGPTPQAHDPAWATVVYDPETQKISTANAYGAAWWPGDDTPTYAQCMSQLGSQAMSHDEASNGTPYKQGQGMCIRSFGGAALVFVRGVSPAGTQAIEMDAIRWNYGG